jgi:DNA/RNA-binding domain of Phe-tRNA-synthetase-like protein
VSREISLESFLAGASVAPEVFELRPDYRALLIAVEGLSPIGPSAAIDALVAQAEESARQAIGDHGVDQVPHVSAWRDAYRDFGAKPQRFRNSLESLMRRAVTGLPRINALTDIYNAVSVLHQIPLGGEDLDGYVGFPRLIRSDGTEPFDTTADGQALTEFPEPGEVVWTDDAGVTCRRWNWRQGVRTRLTEDTTRALFILDALRPVTDGELASAGAALADGLRSVSSGDLLIRTQTLGP